MAAVPPVPFTSDSGAALETLRTPPYSMEAEEAVVGGLLLDNTAWDKVADLINEEDFFRQEHRTLFRAIGTLAKNNDPFDAVTLADRLKDTGESSSSVLSYLASLVKDTPSAANIIFYARIVLDKSIRRRLIATANTIIEEATQPNKAIEATQLLDEAEQSVFAISDENANKAKEFVALSQVGIDTFSFIEETAKHVNEAGSHITGLATGFHEFDNQTSGLQNGDLIIIAGRPSMGKTSLAMNFVANAAIAEKKGPIAIFSLEMSATQLAMRFYSSLAHINQLDLRRGKLRQEEWPRLTSAMKMLQNTSVYIDDSSNLTPLDMRSRVRRLKREHKGLSLIVIDYLQMMKYQDRTDNRVVEISEISRSLKSLAREMEVPVIALSQLNRAVESRSDSRPMMADLRESGAIEQDADLILFIYRDEVYNKETTDAGIAEINVAKQRNGPQFKIKLTFLGQYSRFENYVSEDSYAARAGHQPVAPNRIDVDDVI